MLGQFSGLLGLRKSKRILASRVLHLSDPLTMWLYPRVEGYMDSRPILSAVFQQTDLTHYNCFTRRTCSIPLSRPSPWMTLKCDSTPWYLRL